MKTIPSCADKPGGYFVGAVAFAPGLIERKVVNGLAALIEPIEFLAETVEMLPNGRDTLDRGFCRSLPLPIRDLITKNCFSFETQASGDCVPGRSQCLDQLELTPGGLGRDDAAENLWLAFNLGDRRGQGDRQRPRGSGEVGSGQLDMTCVLENPRLKGPLLDPEKRT